MIAELVNCGPASRKGQAYTVTNRHDAALVRCIDFKREFGKLPTDAQTLLLLAYREKHSHQVVAQITG